MGFYDHFHKKIASGSSVHAGLTLVADADALSVVDTGRNGYLDGLLAADITRAAAVRALVLDDLSASSAVRACLHISNSAEEGLLREHHLALAAALGAHLRSSPGLGARSRAGRAWILEIKCDLLLDAGDRFEECDPHAGADIGPLHRTVCRPASSAAEEISEQVSENIAEIGRIEIEAAKTAASVERRKTKLIVLRTLLRVAQDRIGLRGLLEFGFRILVAGVHVRMVFFGQFPVRLLYIFLGRVFGNSKHFIVITFLFSHNTFVLSRIFSLFTRELPKPRGKRDLGTP